MGTSEGFEWMYLNSTAGLSLSLLPQTVENATLLSASFKKGFVVGGSSAALTWLRFLSHRARDDPFFRDTPLTGQMLQYPLLIHPEAYPDEYVIACPK